MTARRSGTFVVLVLGSALGASQANAYDKAGHFFGSVAIVTDLCPGLTPQEAALTAFCAQLPDESKELDAVQLYSDATRFWVAYKCGWFHKLFGGGCSDEVRRMVTVQQLLHGLTGGEAEVVQHIARDTVRDLASQLPDTPDRGDALCALGFALHLYGDSFAHQTLDPPASGPLHMYDTGRGHAADMHYPDYPLYERTGEDVRWNGWSRYVLDEPSYLTRGWHDRALIDAALGRMRSIATEVRDAKLGFSDYGELRIRPLLIESVPSDHVVRSIAKVVEPHSPTPCQSFVDETLHDLTGDGKSICTPSCMRAWRRFRDAVKPRFDADGRALVSWNLDPLDPDLRDEATACDPVQSTFDDGCSKPSGAEQP